MMKDTKDTTKRLLFIGWKQQQRTSAEVGLGITRIQLGITGVELGITATFQSRLVPSSEHDNRLSFSNDQTKSTTDTHSGNYPHTAGNYPCRAENYPHTAGNYLHTTGNNPHTAGNYPRTTGNNPCTAGNYLHRASSCDVPQDGT